MLPVALDFRDEVDELHAFLQTLKPEDWKRETGFMHWTPWDVVAHLHYYDHVSMRALEGAEAFTPERDALFSASRLRSTAPTPPPVNRISHFTARDRSGSRN